MTPRRTPVADRRHPSASGVNASLSLARTRRRGVTRPDRTSFRRVVQRIGRVFAVLVVVVEQAVQLVDDLAQEPADVALAHPQFWRTPSLRGRGVPLGGSPDASCASAGVPSTRG